MYEVAYTVAQVHFEKDARTAFLDLLGYADSELRAALSAELEREDSGPGCEGVDAGQLAHRMALLNGTVGTVMIGSLYGPGPGCEGVDAGQLAHSMALLNGTVSTVISGSLCDPGPGCEGVDAGQLAHHMALPNGTVSTVISGSLYVI